MMILEIEWIITFLTLGCFVGVFAGLLGIGGGVIMVPVLTSIFLLQGISANDAFHFALGTSMASIILISLSSLRAHHGKGAVLWPVVKSMTFGIVVGAFLATFLVSHTRSVYLALFFSLYLAIVSIQLIFNKKPKPNRELTGTKGLVFSGFGIGSIAALLSIGGGTLTVPFLLWQNIDIKKAIGTSAAIGFPISIVGTLGYVINGWASSSIENHLFGFVYLPAVLLISATSIVTVPLGVNLAHRLPVNILKKGFALLLVILSLKMLTSVL